MHLKGIAGSVLALLLAGSAQAQMAQNTTSTPQWSDVTTVVVRANVPGPVLWKLTKGDSTVWVLGVLPAQFEGTHWDETRVRRLLKGARQLIIPATSTADDDAIALSKATANLPANVHLSDVVSPAVYDRFRRTVRHEDLTLDAYEYLRPMRAGNLLFSDTVSHQGLTISMPEYIATFARALKVPARRAGTVNGSLLLNNLSHLDAAAGEACLVNFLDGIDYDEKVLPKVVKAWGKGDLKTVLENYQDQPYLVCDLANPDSAAFVQAYGVDMMVTALDEALQTPGRTMAVVDLSDLLRKDGVLDKMRAQGIEVTSPEM